MSLKGACEWLTLPAKKISSSCRAEIGSGGQVFATKLVIFTILRKVILKGKSISNLQNKGQSGGKPIVCDSF